MDAALECRVFTIPVRRFFATGDVIEEAQAAWGMTRPPRELPQSDVVRRDGVVGRQAAEAARGGDRQDPRRGACCLS